MSLSMKAVVANAVYVLLAGVTVADVTLFSWLTVLAHRAATDPAPFVREKTDWAASIRPHGFSAAGTEVSVSSSSDKGWAVRYATAGCRFCRADQPKWSALKTELVARGFHIYDIPPYLLNLPSGESAGQKDETAIAFIDIGWMKQYRLTGTPTTLIFDRHGKIIWAHAGTMDEQDQKSALLTISLNK